MEQKQSLQSLPSIKLLEENYASLSNTHLRDLLKDDARNNQLKIESDDFIFDFSHEKMNIDTMKLLSSLAKEAKVKEQFEQMFNGTKINTCENRSVLHRALRMDKSQSLIVDGVDVVKEVHQVLDRIKTFSNDVRDGNFKGFTGKKMKNFISIGIGGSYLGSDFVFNALKSHKDYEKLSEGLQLRFIANVCPVDFHRATFDLDVEETLIIVVSKTFTTAETMLNAKNCKQWLLEQYTKKNPNLSESDREKIIAHHFIAVSTNIEATKKFGIISDNVFGFWDWVGGRYSVWSAVGALPLSLYFSFNVFEEFLKGGKAIDDTIESCTDVTKNPAIMLGLLGFYNTFIAKLSTRAILPYSQALCKFPAHIQQLDMESNGKGVSKITNDFVDYECGPVVFGEAGTNGQHSFYQLIHQGRKLSCEFIGHATPQFDSYVKGEKVTSHVELMCNFFAQPDALAYGKFTAEDLKGIDEKLVKHKTFKGDRPSLSILFKELNAHTVGELLALYEHRVATEGFIYGINSFDQWGVELGKKLATGVRDVLSEYENKKAKGEKENLEEKLKGGYNSATIGLIKFFVENKK